MCSMERYCLQLIISREEGLSQRGLCGIYLAVLIVTTSLSIVNFSTIYRLLKHLKSQPIDTHGFLFQVFRHRQDPYRLEHGHGWL